MVAMLLKTFWNPFPWMQMYDFQIISLIQHCPCNYLVPSVDKLFLEPTVTQIHISQITPDISESPIDFQWGSRKYSG